MVIITHMFILNMFRRKVKIVDEHGSYWAYILEDDKYVGIDEFPEDIQYFVFSKIQDIVYLSDNINQPGVLKTPEFCRVFGNSPLRFSSKALERLHWCKPEQLYVALAVYYGQGLTNDNHKVKIRIPNRHQTDAIFRIYKNYLILETLIA